MEQKRYPKNHFIGLGIAIGIPLGMPIALAIGNIALGPAIGVMLGISIGIALEKKKNPNPLLLSKNEDKIRKRNLSWLTIIGIIIFIAIIIFYFFMK